MPEILRLILQEQTFLGRIVGYRKGTDDFWMYWKLNTGKGLTLECRTSIEQDQEYVPSCVLDVMQKKYFKQTGI